MSSRNWSGIKNAAVVVSYFAMLTDELSGRRYNKALQDQVGRSRGSIEFKLCNLSAACRGLDLPIA